MDPENSPSALEMSSINEHLFHVRRDLYASNDLADSVRRALRHAVELTECQAAAAYLFSKNSTLERTGLFATQLGGRPLDVHKVPPESFEHAEDFVPTLLPNPERFAFGQPVHAERPAKIPLSASSCDLYREILGSLDSFAAAPLNGVTQTYGALAIFNKRGQPTKFVDRDFDWLAALAVTLADRVTSLRVHNNPHLLQKLQYLLAQHLIDSARDGEHETSIDQTYSNLLGQVLGPKSSYKAAVLRVGLNGPLPVVARNNDPDVKWTSWVNHELDKDSWLAGKVFTAGTPQYVSDISTFSSPQLLANLDWMKQNGIRSLACLPLHVGGTLGGTLTIYAGFPKTYSPNDIAFLHTVAAALGSFAQRQHIAEELARVSDQLDSDRNDFISSARKVGYTVSAEEYLHRYKNTLLDVSKTLKDVVDATPGRRRRLVADQLANIDSEIKRVTREFDRGDSAHETLHVADVISKAYRFFKDELRRKKIKFKLNRSTDLPPIRANRAELRDIIHNLIANSIRAIQASNSKLRELTLGTDVTTINNIRYLQISVADTGIGIRHEHEDLVFDRGFTTYSGGTGMGLTLAKEIVESKYGGRIRFDSSVGKGTTFYVALPLARLSA